ncbi:NAD-dependent epimerase/dehydratase family protein [Sulfurospirillum sp.]|nr:NAD-dependent epimerase/dehydratase family protein [Sulfurospirillum sp.]
MKKITILGTGWLGFNLAKRLQKEGYKVTCSYRNKLLKSTLREKKINSLYVDLNENILPDAIFESDVLCIFIPPSQNKEYKQIFQNIVEHKYFKKIKQVIFSSSTSVYQNENDDKHENSLIKDDNQMVNAENILKEFSTSCILRFAGLMGEDRYLSKYYNETVKNAQTRVNHIHLEDAIGILEEVISKNIHGIYNICSPLHPTKEEVIKEQCNILNKKEPFFEKGDAKKAIILTDKIDKKIFYMYKHPNPVHFPLIKNQAPF